MAVVDRQGVEIFIEDSDLAAAAARAHEAFEGTGQAAVRMAETTSRAAQVADAGLRQFREGIQLLTRGTIRYDVASGAFVTSTGKQASALQVLNSLGIQTTAQIEAQKAALIDIAGAYSKDAAVVAQLAEAQRRLGITTKTSTERFGGAQQAVFSFGNIVQDSAQFTFGFGQGIRAIANNFGPFIQQISGARGGLRSFLSQLAGPAGIVLAINAVTTAVLLFGDKIGGIFGRAASQAKELAKAVGEAVGSILSLTDAVRLEGTAGQLGQAVALAKEQREAQEATLEAAKQMRDLGFGAGGGREAVVRANQAVTAAADELKIRKATEESLKAQLLTAQGQARAAAFLKEAGFTRVRTQAEENKALRDALELVRNQVTAARNFEERMKAVLRAFDKVQEHRRALSRDPIFQRTGLVELPTPGALVRQRGALGTQDVALPAGATLRPGPSREAMQSLIKDYEAALAANERYNAALLVGVDLGFRFADGIADLAGNLLFFSSGVSEVERRLALLDFDRQRKALRAAFREGNLGAEEFQLRMALIAEQQKEFIASTQLLTNAWRGFQDVLKGVIADLIRAAIRAAALKAILTLFGVSTGGFGSLFLSGLGIGTGGVGTRTASAPVGAPLAVSLSGNLDVGTDRVRFALSENAARARR